MDLAQRTGLEAPVQRMPGSPGKRSVPQHIVQHPLIGVVKGRPVEENHLGLCEKNA